MTSEEKSILLDKFASMHKADMELMAAERELRIADRKRIDELLEALNLSNVEMRGMREQIADLLKLVKAANAENISLKEELRVYKKDRYGKKSQRGSSARKEEPVSHEESK